MDGISIREASENLPGLIERVERGEDVVITRDGVPVARLVAAPPAKRTLTPEQERLLTESEAFLLRGWQLGVGRLDREALYDDIIGTAPRS